MADPASLSNLEQVHAASFHLDLDVDFAAKVLKGSITVKAEALTDANSIALDTKDLTISKVEDGKGAPLKYELLKPHPVFGSKLEIKFGEKLAKGESTDVKIYYATSPKSSAIQWLPPSNTSGKKHPYLFTQCQAIHARAMFPCMDSPGIKSKYSARVTVPDPLVALMSAARLKRSSDGKKSVYTFEQNVPTPAYLVALVVGALEERKIGPRSSVWSEAEMVDAGAKEFEDTELYLKTAEDIAGPYVWGRYDILLLPPSFPYGGMENPCLTFVTPTLLAGDKSLATVVIHEIAHSWMGNLVTCKTWVDFWMNEGFCRILELKIIKALFGDKHFDLYACIGLKALQESIRHFGCNHEYTKMRPDLKDVDPDDAFSSVPYEKGMNFLIYLENLVGGEKLFNPFLKAYCENFKYKTITAKEFQKFFLGEMKGKVDDKKLGTIEWEKWMTSTGMPYVENKFDTTLIDESIKAAESCCKGGDVERKMVDKWSTPQKVVFFDKLETMQIAALEKAKSAGTEEKEKEKFREILTTLDKACEFSKSRNSEIRFRWYKLGIRCDFEEVFPDTVKFITAQGRMKFVRPLYRLLFGSKGKKLALDTFKSHREMYHAIAAKMLEKDLKCLPST
ncbi:hypothetical protein AAMO2058_000234400 [Amorphochlora amoebiformis]